MQHTFARVFGRWVPLVVALTGVFGCVYLVAQQNYRQSLNDPQIQIAEDAAMVLEQEPNVPAAVVPRGVPVDLAKSLAPFIAVYDSTGKPLESSGVLDGAPPQPPLGVFDDTTWRTPETQIVNGMKETRVTWQSKSGVRQALVMVHLSEKDGGDFVVVGRNMRSTESRIEDLGYKLLFGWAFTCLATLVAIGVVLLFG